MLVAKVIHLLYSVILLPEICNKTFCEEIQCHCVACNTDRQRDRQAGRQAGRQASRQAKQHQKIFSPMYRSGHIWCTYVGFIFGLKQWA